MEKNIIVTDPEGNVIGSTYPKRAKGLLRSGRAVAEGADCIRLLSADPPVAEVHFLMEDYDMSQTIGFKAREFHFDPSCDVNTGSRQIITLNGENIECFEIGDAEDVFGCETKIRMQKDLEAHTDYLFAFTACSSYTGRESAASQAIIYYGDHEEDAFTYPLDRVGKSLFQPTLCKRFGDELLRVFEIPFTTEQAGSYTIVIRVKDMEFRLFPAKPAESYAELADISYEQWMQEEQHKWVARLGAIGSKTQESLSGLGDQLGESLSGMGEKITKFVTNAVSTAGAAAQKAAQKASEKAESFKEKAEKAADAADATAETLKEEVDKATDSAAETAQKMADDISDAVKEAAAPASEAAEEAEVIIDSTAELVSDGSDEAKTE